MLFIAFAALSSCKKNELSQEKSNSFHSKTSQTKLASDYLVNNLTVSSNGYLILDNETILQEYLVFLDGNNSTDILALHSTIGFTSQADYSSSDNYFGPSEDNLDYLFNSEGVVQLGDHVIRSINSENYFLTVSSSTINSTIYADLVGKNYNSMSMNRISYDNATVLSYETLLDFLDATPSGYDGPINNPPATGKLFGWTKNRIYTMGAYAYTVYKFYLFGIKVHEHTGDESNP